MKKNKIKLLDLSKKQISRLNNLQTTIGGNVTFTTTLPGPTRANSSKLCNPSGPLKGPGKDLTLGTAEENPDNRGA